MKFSENTTTPIDTVVYGCFCALVSESPDSSVIPEEFTMQLQQTVSLA